jgi:hypothetical protein
MSVSKKKTVKKSNTIKLKFDSSWSYAPAPESKSAASINKQYDLFINGEWQKPLSKKYFDTINPATEEKLSEVAEANTADVNKAVWRQVPLMTRSGKKCRPKKEPNTFSGSPAWCRKKQGSWPSLKHWMEANPFVKAGILMCPQPPIISFIMPAGPINLNTHSQTENSPAWCGRSDHSLELSPADGSLENCTGPGHRKYSDIKTRGDHAVNSP